MKNKTYGKFVIGLVVVLTVVLLSACGHGFLHAASNPNKAGGAAGGSAGGQSAPPSGQNGVAGGRGGNPAGLTQDQMTAFQTAMQASMKTELDTLVSNGTITQDQADSILASSGQPRQQGQSGQNGQPGQNGQNTNRGQAGRLYSGLGLTQDQITAVRQATANASKDALDALVSNGTITQDQADQMSGFGTRGPGANGNSNPSGNGGSASGASANQGASNAAN